jgi:hypothetical protein
MNYLIPPFQPQSSPPFDGWSCTDSAFINCVEMYQGAFQQWSVSGLAVDAGTQVGMGTSLQAVVNAANKRLISYASRPLQPIFNQSEYFAPITLAQASTANKSMLFTIEPPDLKISPIILELNEGSTTHMVVTRDMVNYIDSYAPQIKPIDWSKVIGQWSIKINPKFMNAYGFQVPGNPTVYVPMFSFLIPLASWQSFVNIGGSQASIVPVTQQWLDAQAIVGNDYFGSKN